MTYLKQGNRELRKDGIFVWSIPALNARLSDGSNFVTCPNAGVCANLCYARSGTYRFSNVYAAHLRNLEATFDLLGWTAEMIAELEAPRFRGGKYVRIHDAGDFYSAEYLQAWADIAQATPDVTFYAYTKEVEMVKAATLPDNLRIVFSMGGKQDHLVGPDDRHAEVFPDLETLHAAGYQDQTASDLLAITLPTNRIGIPANNLRHLRKRQGSASFGQLQRQREDRRAARSNP